MIAVMDRSFRLPSLKIQHGTAGTWFFSWVQGSLGPGSTEPVTKSTTLKWCVPKIKNGWVKITMTYCD